MCIKIPVIYFLMLIRIRALKNSDCCMASDHTAGFDESIQSNTGKKS